MMASQDDLGMLWYGVTGVSFNPADPAEVMLNTGTAAPLLSDHPRPLVPTPVSYNDPMSTHHTQMLYDPNTGDYSSQAEYMYEGYEGYDEDSSGSVMHQQGETPPISEPGMVGGDESPPPLPKSKKPKVHQHPALKLKTPIAYQKDTDLNAIPIMREGMAVCEKCGAIGVKHAFYGKERKFCSLACARGPLLSSHHQACEREMELDPNNDPEKKFIPVQRVIGQPTAPLERLPSPIPVSHPPTPSPVAPVPPPTPAPEPITTTTQSTLPPPESTVDLDGTFSWASSYLDDADFQSVPVRCFKHSPMAECWDQMGAGMKVEVSCKEEAVTKDAFWVATVIAVAGYKAKLRFEGFVDDSSKDFWVDLCSEEVHPVGWCATQGRPLIPPRSIQHKYRDWKEFLMRRLTGARTLPTNFISRVVESQKSRFRPGLNVEVVDKNRIAQMRVATVTEVVGKRLHLKYHGAPPDDNGFWCHEDAPIIHPVGWSREVGHEIVASQSYHEKCICGTYDPNDAPPELFVPTPFPAFLRNSKMTFCEGMKLEAIDPLNLSAICVATVMKVLHNNYLMIRIDSYESDNTCSDWFCYHATSPCIFPAGFCEMNNITLTPPRGYEGQFSWFTYLKKTQATAAPPALFNRDVPSHGFEEGHALESADLMDPRLVCVAMIKEVKGRLLKVHFDGWENDFDQWIDCYSPDIYPVGWCDMSGYRLEGPKIDVPIQNAPKRKLKGGGKHAKAGRRGRPLGSKKMGKATIVPIPPLPPQQQSQMSLAQRKRGRPPKEKGLGSTNPEDDIGDEIKDEIKEECTDMQSVEMEHSSSGNKNHQNQTKRDSRRSPRGSSGTSPLSGNQPIRATRARTLPVSYNQSDEEEASDDTSSGVASLDGNESSQESWDMDEGSCNVPSNNPSPLPPTDYNAPETSENFGDIELKEEEDETSDQDDQDNIKEEDQVHQAITTQKATATHQHNNPQGVQRVASNTAAVQQTQAVRVSKPQPITNMPHQTNSHPPTSTVKNGISQVSQQSKVTSQSPTISSTVGTVSAPRETPVLAPQQESIIPRMIDGPVRDGSKVKPKLWTPQDVAMFLKKNDCGAYCDNFIAQNIHGTKLLTLTQNEVMGLTGMKVGPSLKIHDLVQQLLALVNPAQARYQATLMKRGLSFT